jgi:hypothetical protein
VEVDIQIERATEALDKGDRTRLGRLTGKLGFLDQVRGDSAVDNAEHLTMTAGRLANRKRNGYGMLSTHWRTGCSGNTSSTSTVALSAMRRAPQLGQKPSAYS